MNNLTTTFLIMNLNRHTPALEKMLCYCFKLIQLSMVKNKESNIFHLVMLLPRSLWSCLREMVEITCSESLSIKYKQTKTKLILLFHHAAFASHIWSKYTFLWAHPCMHFWLWMWLTIRRLTSPKTSQLNKEGVQWKSTAMFIVDLRD